MDYGDPWIMEHNRIKRKLCNFSEAFTIYVICSAGPSLVDILWGQRIKLIQVVSTSEFHEYLWNEFGFFLSPRLVAGPRKPQKLTTSKIKYEHFGTKIIIPH